MESLRNDVKIAEEEMKNKLENGKSEEVIPPLDVKDYNDLGFIIKLEELVENSYENNVNIDFNVMFSDFFGGDEERLLEMSPPYFYDEKEIFDPPVVLPIIEPSFMKSEKWMEIDPPEEIKLGGGEPSLISRDTKNWDYELMKWIWSPNSYEEFLRFYNQG